MPSNKPTTSTPATPSSSESTPAPGVESPTRAEPVVKSGTEDAEPPRRLTSPVEGSGIEFFDGTIVKINADGNEVMSDHLAPGETLRRDVSDRHSTVKRETAKQDKADKRETAKLETPKTTER